MSNETTLRGLPAVHRFLSDPRFAAFDAFFGKDRVKSAVNDVLDAARRSGAAGATFDAIAAEVLERLQREWFDTLVPAINATGVLLHTNLGRAPLAQAAIDAIGAASRGYSNLEYDLIEGHRGSRYARASALLRTVTGAQDALVVNNCAAAVLLILDTFAKGREAIVARGELVEIGGGFRLPDVLERSGAILIEVGATNKVYIQDYERALTPRTGLLLRTHPSNFRIEGFTAQVEGRDLAQLARRAGIPAVEDLGGGALVDLQRFGLPHERTVQEALLDGIDLVTFSGDKLLGGPQAGIIAGNERLIARLRNNPLLRALRVDKITIAALSETLRMYAVPERVTEIPFFAMLSASLEELRGRAKHYCDAFPGAKIVESAAYAGGGALPAHEVPSIAVALPARSPSDLAAKLRTRRVPVVARVEQNRVVLDLRTVLPEEDAQVLAALRELAA